MRPLSPLRCACLLTLCAGLCLLPGCGGGTGSNSTNITPPTPIPGTPIANCQIKQINALKPPCPNASGVSCTTASCTGNSCSTLSQGGWQDFSEFILGSSAIYGVNIYVPWSSVETSQGVYDFSALDSQVGYYQRAYPSKRVNLTWMAVNYGSVNDSQGGVNYMTPGYVFTSSWASSVGASPQDVAYCSNYEGANKLDQQGISYTNILMGNFDATGYPVVYEAPFVSAYQKFIAAVLAHYPGTFTNIGYIRFGLSVGDEADAYCTPQLQTLPSPNTFSADGTITTWQNYVGGMYSFEKGLKPGVQLMQSLNSLDADSGAPMPAFEAATAVADGFGFGSNGWQATDIAAAATAGASLCTADWCALFDQYHSSGVPLELQPANPSDSTPNNPTGNLADLIAQTAATNYATILEIAQSDLYLALEPGYTPPDPSDASNASAYQAAITQPCDNH